MNSVLDRCYELLGVRPGVSVRELKSAYRDLAKVWHPDRFAHDPRLQQKAQEKLKEINDAYEQLISGKTPRATVATGCNANDGRQNSSKRNESQRVSFTSRLLIWIVIPVIIFSSVFVLTVRIVQIQRNRQAQLTAADYESAGSTNPEPTQDTEVRSSVEQKRIVPSEPQSEVQPIATTTVLIDSTNGLLAGEGCPTTTRMTYPSGEEPKSRCTLHKRTPQKESRIKQLSKQSSPEDSDESEKDQPQDR